MDLELRKQGVGGSEVAAVMGLSPWEGPLQVYARKLGLAEEAESTLPMKIGVALEEVILQEYSKIKGVQVGRNARTWQHPTKPWRLATPDGFAGNGNTIKWGVEAKAVGSALGFGEGQEDVPAHYLIQCLWYRNVMSDVLGIQIPWWDLVVLIGNKEVRVYRIEQNDDLELAMLDAVDTFWQQHVEPQIPPPVTSPRDRKMVDLVYPQTTQEVRTASPEEEELIGLLQEAWLKKREAEATFDLVAAKVAERIGESAGLVSSYGKITWSKSKDSEQVDWKAVAQALSAPEELLKQHTKVRPGVRRLVVPRSWGQTKD